MSIVNEFHAKGPVTDTLLPMTVLDDVVGIIVFFTVNSLVARQASGGVVPLYMIPVMILLPVFIGVIVGFPTDLLLKKGNGRVTTYIVLLSGITATMVIGWGINTFLLTGITLNYMLMGVSFAAAIVDLGAPLNYHLILGAGIAVKKGFEQAGEIKK